MGLQVRPEQLRASAQAADVVAQDLVTPMERAVTVSASAGASLAGWSVGGELGAVAASWKGALSGLHRRLQAGAANLRSCAQQHEWNEQRVTRDFERMQPAAGGPFG